VTVAIVQGDGGVIKYDGNTVFVTDRKTSRSSFSESERVEIGKITIPFSKSFYTVGIDNRLRSATINTSTGALFDAKIEAEEGEIAKGEQLHPPDA